MNNDIDKTNVEIMPLGSDEKIKLNIGIVQRLIAVPTRSGKIPNPDQCMKFLMLCKAKHLNPFEGDCYLLGYDTQSGPQFSQITAHQVFLKRAEASEQFDGMESGVIIKTSEGIEERQGDLVLDGEELIGGWAKAYRKDRTHCIYRRIKLSTFNTGQSRWAKDPAGMICKVAEADALRTSFPSHLGGLYITEEREPIDITPEIPRPTFQQPKITAPAATEPPFTADQEAAAKPRKRKKADGPTSADYAARIKQLLSGDGFTEDDLLTVANQLKWADAWTLEEIPTEKLEKWIAEWKEIKTQISDYKAVTAQQQKSAEPEMKSHQDALFS